MNQESMPDKAGVIIFPPLLFFGSLLLGELISYFFPFTLFPIWDSTLVGASLMLIAAWILRNAAMNMIKHRTTINPAGSTTSIVQTGVYQYTRNPMYLSFTLIFLGISLISNAWFNLVLLLPMLFTAQKGIIEKEEKYLARKFGLQYLNYKKKVRRWL